MISNHFKPDNIFFYTDSLKNYIKTNKISSALDILCQSIESIFSVNSNIKSLAFAKKSLKILDKNLKEYLSDGEEYAYVFRNGEWVCYNMNEFNDKSIKKNE